MSLALPLYVMLIPYALFLAFFVFFALVNIYNLARYGARNMVGFVVSFLFIAGTVCVMYVIWRGTVGIDWITPVPVLENVSTSF